MNLQNFLENTILNNGATIATNGQNLSNGYLVSLHQFGQSYNSNDFNLATIKSYFSKNEIELNKENRFLGSWIENGIIYLDISVLITDKRTAIYKGYENNQRSIFDTVNNVCISLPTPQKSGTATQQRAYLTSVIDRLCK